MEQAQVSTAEATDSSTGSVAKSGSSPRRISRPKKEEGIRMTTSPSDNKNPKEQPTIMSDINRAKSSDDSSHEGPASTSLSLDSFCMDSDDEDDPRLMCSEMVFDEESSSSSSSSLSPSPPGPIKSGAAEDDRSDSSHMLTMTPEILEIDPVVNNSDQQLDEAEQGLVAVGVELLPEAVAVPEESFAWPQQTQNRAAFISITVEKQSKDTKLGIALREFDGHLQIFSIAENGVLSGAPFRPGDTLQSINNFRCSLWDPSKAMNKLKEIEGPLTIIVQHNQGDPNLVEAMVKKPSRDCKVGIGFMSLRHFLAIGSINAEGYFACSVLNVGDRVISINGNLCCQMSPDDAVTLVKNVDDSVRFICQRASKTGIVVSRHSFRSTASSIRTLDEPRLLSAIDHGSKRSYTFYAFLIIVAFSVVYAIQRVK